MSRNYFSKPVDEGNNWLNKNEIHSGVTFDSIEYVRKTSKEGNPYAGLELKFSKMISNEQYRFETMILPVNESWADGDEEVLDGLYNDLNRKLMHIAQAVGIDPEALAEKLSSPTFEGSAIKFAAVVGSKLADKKFHLKLFSRAGYAALPKYPKFLQEDTPDAPCVLQFTDWEKNNMETNAPKGGEIASLDDLTEDGEDVEDLSFSDLDL